MNPYEIGGLVITLLLFIGCIIYCCKLTRQKRYADQGQRYRQFNGFPSKNTLQKSAWDVEEDDDPWAVSTEGEEEEKVTWPTRVIEEDVGTEEEGKRVPRQTRVTEKRKPEVEIRRDMDGSIRSSTSRSQTAVQSATVNNWMIHFNDG